MSGDETWYFKKKTARKASTHDVLNVVPGEVEMGEGPEVVLKGDAAFLFLEVSRIDYELRGQGYHGGPSVLPHPSQNAHHL